MIVGNGLLGTHFYITRPSLCLLNETTSSITEDGSTMFTNSTSTDRDDFCNSQYAPLAICSMVLFSLAFSVCWRSLPMIIKSETLPLTVRGLSGGIVDTCSWVTEIAIFAFYYRYEQAVKPYVAWWSFASICFIGKFFVIAFIPETKGRTLEEIEHYFRGRKSCCVFRESIGKASDCTDPDLYLEETV